jgi:hypothetical protein
MVLAQEEYFYLKTGVHLSSTASGDRYSIRDLAQILNKNQIEVGLLSDHLNAEVEYGIWPLRNLIKKTVSRPSIVSFGIKNYLAEINKINALSQVTLIPGGEVAPFYYWEGSLWTKNLALRNWHRHLLILGLTEPEDYENIPTLSNGLSRRFSMSSLINLLYIGFFILGLIIYKKKSSKTLSFQGINYQIPTRKNKIIGFMFVSVALIFLVNNFPYKLQKYDAYHGDPGAEPYQDVINYVNDQGGLTFWAHPEVGHNLRANWVEAYSPPYPELLLQTSDYTGFAIFWEGMKTIGVPGGIWDKVLLDYCAGNRSKPIWAIGELDFENAEDATLIRETSTIVLSRGHTAERVLEALRSGRMYATRNFSGDYLKLTEFSLSTQDRSAKAVMGETLNGLSIPIIKISVASSKESKFKIQLIRDGEIIEEFNFDQSIEIEYRDNELQQEGPHFYRLLLLENDWTVLASNPIFVNFD